MFNCVKNTHTDHITMNHHTTADAFKRAVESNLKNPYQDEEPKHIEMAVKIAYEMISEESSSRPQTQGSEKLAPA